MNKDPQDWNDLLERYANGTISKADRFELEKAALDDPFLFEALEGYGQQNPAENKKSKIEPKTKSLNYSWIKIAASLLVLVTAFYGIGTVFNSMDSSKEKISHTGAAQSEDGFVLAEKLDAKSEGDEERTMPTSSNQDNQIKTFEERKEKLPKKDESNPNVLKKKEVVFDKVSKDLNLEKNGLEISEAPIDQASDMVVAEQVKVFKNVPSQETVLQNDADEDIVESAENRTMEEMESVNSSEKEKRKLESKARTSSADMAGSQVGYEAVPSQAKAGAFDNEIEFSDKSLVKPKQGFDWLDAQIRKGITLDPDGFDNAERRIILMHIFVKENKVSFVSVEESFCETCKEAVLQIIYNSGDWVSPLKEKEYKLEHAIQFE